jgi:hypothetical protein
VIGYPNLFIMAEAVIGTPIPPDLWAETVVVRFIWLVGTIVVCWRFWMSERRADGRPRPAVRFAIFGALLAALFSLTLAFWDVPVDDQNPSVALARNISPFIRTILGINIAIFIYLARSASKTLFGMLEIVFGVVMLVVAGPLIGPHFDLGAQLIAYVGAVVLIVAGLVDAEEIGQSLSAWRQR